MEQTLIGGRKALFLRLGAIVFFAELAHGMLLYGIIPEVVKDRFAADVVLFGILPVAALEIAGYCLAAYVLAELAFKLPAGHLVDHRGPDLPLRLGLLLSFATVPLMLLSRSPYVMLLASFAHGVGAAPVWPAVISAWTRGRSARERGEVMGQILTAWMAGIGIGVILGNVLVGLTGRQELIATYSPLSFWLIAVVAALHGAPLAAGAAPAAATERENGGRLPFPRELAVMAVGLFLQNLAFGSLILTFREVATHHLEFNPAQFGLLVALGGAPAVLLLGPMGRVADRIGKRRTVIYSLLVVAPLILGAPLLAVLPLSAWARFALMLPGVLLAAVAYASLLPAWHALALGRIAEQQRGRMLALLMSVEMVALGGGHLLGPSIYEKIHYAAPFLFAGGTFLVLACIYAAGYVLPRELPDEFPHSRRVSLEQGSGSAQP